MTFNEPVSVSGTWFTISSAAAGPITTTVSGGPTTFTLNPPGPFAIGDMITVTVIGNQVTDQASGTLKLGSNPSFSFTTAQPVAPVITANPQSVTANAGDTASFTVAASGTAPISYAWRKDGTFITGNGTASTATLVLTNVASSDGANYDCVVSNSAGSATSAAAALTVTAIAPTITTSPVSATVLSSATVSFTVAATGTSPFTYVWRKEWNSPIRRRRSVGLGDCHPDPDCRPRGRHGQLRRPCQQLCRERPEHGRHHCMSQSRGSRQWNSLRDFSTATPLSGLPADITGATVTQGNNNGTTTLITATSVSSGYPGASGGNNAGAAANVGAFSATGSAYFTFTLTPQAGEVVTTSAISFGSRSTTTGPTSLRDLLQRR